MSPQVDVIVPCYNYGRYLRACIDSLLSQAGVDVRVLIVDDHSTDRSPDIGLALARADERITFRRHVRNHGHIATYNEGLEWVDAPYLLLISADDLLVPGALARATAIMEANRDVTMVHGRQISFKGDPPTVVVNPAEPEVAIMPGAEFIAARCADGENPIATPTVVARTSTQRLVGGYEASLPCTADLEMWLRLAAFGSLAALGAVQALKRGHDHNMQHAFVHQTTGDLLERLNAFRTFLQRPECVLHDRDALLHAAEKALGTAAFWRGAALFDAGAAADADTLIELAVRLDPTLRRRREWRRMQIKRGMGSVVWPRVARAVEAISGGGAARATSARRPAPSPDR